MSLEQLRKAYIVSQEYALVELVDKVRDRAFQLTIALLMEICVLIGSGNRSSSNDRQTHSNTLPSLALL